MKRNKNLPLIISGVIVVLLLVALVASGGDIGKFLSGAALGSATATEELVIGPVEQEEIPGNPGGPATAVPTEAPTATAVPTAVPTDAPAPTATPTATLQPAPVSDANLQISISRAQVNCRQAAFNVSITNSGSKTAATQVDLSVQVQAGTQYISGNAGTTWRIGTVNPGQTKSIQVRFNTNSAWENAAAGTELAVEAAVRSEGTNPGQNVGKSASTNAGNPGGCAPTPTPTPEIAPVETEEVKPTSTPETPVLVACTNWLLFHSERDGNLEIYRLEGSDGAPNSKLYNLSNSRAEDRNPSRSADGLWIAFESKRDGNFEIYLADVAGQNQTRLTDAPSSEVKPAFNPDNRTVVYQSNRNGNWDLYVYDRITRQERQLTSGARDEMNPSWSASGQWLAYQSNEKGNWDILLINLRSGETKELAATTSDEVTPAWSPDGQHIAFLAKVSSNWQVFYSDVDGKNLFQVSLEGAAAAIAWSPNSKILAYQSQRNGNLDIYAFTLANSIEARLTNAAGAESAPSWNCSSSEVYYTARDSQGQTADIEKIDLKGGAPTKLTINPAGDYDAVMAGSQSYFRP